MSVSSATGIGKALTFHTNHIGEVHLPHNAERRTPNTEHRTPNAEQDMLILTQSACWKQPLYRQAQEVLRSMSRMVARSRPKEGKGIGEILSEGIVYVIILAVIGFAARW